MSYSDYIEQYFIFFEEKKIESDSEEEQKKDTMIEKRIKKLRKIKLKEKRLKFIENYF